MLMGFLARYAQACACFDAGDVATSHNVRAILVPKLSAHRRDLLLALAHDRRSSRPLSREVRLDLVAEAAQCRTAVQAANRKLAAGLHPD